jgi:hypothetical protein
MQNERQDSEANPPSRLAFRGTALKVAFGLVCAYALYQFSLVRCEDWRLQGQINSFFTFERLYAECYGWVSDEGLGGGPMCSHHNDMYRGLHDDVQRTLYGR